MQIFFEKVDVNLNAGELHEAAYRLLHRVLCTDFGITDAEIRKTQAGKPYIAGDPVQISLSHTRGFVCCAVDRENGIGIDCEYIRPVSKRAAERVCTPQELEDIWQAKDPDRRFLQYWTLKESISKKRGVGLRESFRQYEIRWDGEEPLCDGYKLSLRQVDSFFIAAAE